MEFNSKKGTIVIREATKKDAKELIKYIHTVSKETEFLLFSDGEFNPTIEEEQNFLESIIQRENQIFLIATIDNKVIAAFDYQGGTRKKIEHTGALGISILKEYWGIGLGTKLFEVFFDWAKSNNITTKVDLSVMTHNKRAIQLYKKMGFEIEGTIKNAVFMNDQYYDYYAMGICF
ncbi:MAG: GNAT family N-acetyltransferase [Peptostreptococcaceae bacterium]|jgi:RimJ/RimL family protein N-acetyltransferase|nr:GNAT family N-acetyltransferase [Peptostreptococcaceae bacterium]